MVPYKASIDTPLKSLPKSWFTPFHSYLSQIITVQVNSILDLFLGKFNAMYTEHDYLTRKLYDDSY